MVPGTKDCRADGNGNVRNTRKPKKKNLRLTDLSRNNKKLRTAANKKVTSLTEENPPISRVMFFYRT